MGKRDRAAKLVATIAARLSQDNWYSTQTTAYSFIAIAKFCGKNASGAKIMASVNIAGTTNDVNSAAYLQQLPVIFKSASVPVVISNKGNNTMYVKLITRGQPLTGDSSRPVNNPSLLALDVDYLSRDGKPVNINALPQGTDFVARVRVRNTGKRGTYTQMALAQVFPSGWEILNARLVDGDEGSFKSSPLTYQDIRDDRVYNYFDINEGQTLTYYVQLNATYPGRYYMPAVQVQAMYDNTISASTAAKWVEVLAH